MRGEKAKKCSRRNLYCVEVPSRVPKGSGTPKLEKWITLYLAKQ